MDKYYKTRFAEDGQSLVYSKIDDGKWSFFHVDKNSGSEWPDRVGPIYASKEELLCDAYRYAKEWGFTV